MTDNLKKFEYLAARYDDSELTAGQRDSLERQAATDPRARKILSQYHRLDQMLGEMPGLIENVDFGRFSKDVSRAIRIGQNSNAGTSQSTPSLIAWLNRQRRIAIPVAAAAAMMLAVLAWAAIFKPYSTQPSSDYTIRLAGGNFVRLFGVRPTADQLVEKKVSLFNAKPAGDTSVEKIVTPVEICLNQGNGMTANDVVGEPGEVIYYTTPRSTGITGNTDDVPAAVYF